MNSSENTNSFDIIIIGGGASGMMAAICAGRFFAQKNKTARIAIVERHARLGRKLAATGNGHCNLSNQDATVKKEFYYHSESPLLFEEILEQFPPEKTISFFESIGILCHTKENGKIYPFCEQAFSVIRALEQELSYLHVEMLLNMEVREITKTMTGSRQSFQITGVREQPNADSKETTKDNFCLYSDKLIAATGGKASPSLSSDGLGYGLLQSLSHTCTGLYPAIVQIRTVTDFIAPLAGTKWNAGISLMKVSSPGAIQEIIRKESGELLFTKYGISGPPVLQLAGSIRERTKNPGERADYYAVIDFLEEFSVKDLVSIFSKRIQELGPRPIHNILVGVLPYKIATALAEKVFPRRENRLISTISEQDLALLVSHLKKFPLKILGTAGWEEAQVTAGGIRGSELNHETLESILCTGLYITGEVLDVDGDCGGFNLQFAWASGCIAGESAAGALLEENR